MSLARVLRPASLMGTLAFAAAAAAWYSPSRAIGATLVLCAYLCACAGIVAAHRARTDSQRRLPSHDVPSRDVILVAFASQTGSAEQLATQTRRALEAAGARVRFAALGTLGIDDLAAHSRALFVVSTTGEGDAPDHAEPFVRRVMGGDTSARLASLRFGVLALGDRHYENYCAFGHRLAAWLAEREAQASFDTIEANNGEAAALDCWQAQLAALCNGAAFAPSATPRDSIWTLETRALLNPGSAGAPAFHLGLAPRDAGALAWHAGDIAEIAPRHARATVQQWLDARGLDGNAPVCSDGVSMTLADALATRQLPFADTDAVPREPQAWAETLAALPRRSYSIASLPGEGRIELLVRQMREADALAHGGFRLGLASGWLTEHAAHGGEITLRVRTNRAFHAPADDRPMILIGNGTGLAGLRAHLKARAHAGHARNWLIFGERSAQRDAFYRDELERWLAEGLIERLDCAWSRDAGATRYVQDVLDASAQRLVAWIDDGASIYVCGSLNSMAPAVHQALLAVLGAARMDALVLAGRYRRDVY